jgi:hypothetical protein
MDVDVVEQRTHEMARRLRLAVRRSPYRTLLVAMAAGYVLGGGLTPRALGFVVANAGRLMAGSLLVAVLRGLIDEDDEDEEGRTSCR